MAKKIRKITKEYLKKAAFYYLGRYASGEGNLRYILENKVKKASYAGSDIPSETGEWIKEVVHKCSELGLASDREYARMKVQTLLGQGKSLRKIQLTLRQKRVPEDISTEALAPFMEEAGETDLKSALKYAKKRRFGLYRNAIKIDPEKQEEALRKKREKELSAMVRAGFSYRISTEILDAKPE